MNEQRQRITIVGGTAAICFWLFLLTTQACEIRIDIDRIADLLEKQAQPVEGGK